MNYPDFWSVAKSHAEPARAKTIAQNADFCEGQMKQRNVGRVRAAPRSGWFGPSARDPANHDASGPATPWDGKGRAIETQGCRSTGPGRQLRQLQNSQRNRLLVLQLKPPQPLRARRDSKCVHRAARAADSPGKFLWDQ